MNATSRLAILLAAVAFVSPDTLIAAPHNGQVVRNGFALSDLALFVFAGVSVFLARRSLRARARRAKD